MDNTKMLALFTVVQALQCATAMFFHEPSHMVAQGVGAINNSDFGFAMAYRTNFKTLVVGAPKADKIGKVFNCEIRNQKNISCGEQYIDYEESDYNTEKFPDQRFHLGSSIVAASKYIFTCAPLWTRNVYNFRENALVADAFGTCFKQDDPVNKSGGKKRNPPLTLARFTGGTGWSTLLDEKNDLLLIATTSFKGDISYVPASNAILGVKSLVHTYGRYLAGYWNMGFALTAGKFFSDKTVYAFSMLQKNMEGLILFLEYNNETHDFSLSMLAASNEEAQRGRFIEVTSYSVGTMFGNVMSSADLNVDGFDELLVGAPAQTEDECFECGALHIYTGGDDKTINEPKRLRSIFGTSKFARFGSAIVAKDIDGDGKPELVVSAPYENHGSGAIYILSGYEIYHTLMKTQEFMSIQLSDLKLTQKLQKESYRTLGFSLEFVEDVDGNGCDELAAGSPGGSKVLIFKCVRNINVTLSAELIGDQIVKEQVTSFIVQVCARVEYPALPDEIIGNLTIENNIFNETVAVLQPVFVIDISCDSCFNKSRNFCKNITVVLNDMEEGRYTFKSKAKLQNSFLSDKNMPEFNKTWVVASSHSKLDTSLIVSRQCQGDDCKPLLELDFHWSGSNPYLLSSSANETVKITVSNKGHSSYGACVWLKVSGGQVTVIGCEDDDEGYRCSTPLKRGSNVSIDLQMNMVAPSTIRKNLLVKTHLYENCNNKKVYTNKTLKIDYVITTHGVSNEGDNHRLNITDKQIWDNAVVYDHHEFSIKNYGGIKWEAVEFSILMEKEPYINSFKVSVASKACETNNEEGSSFIKYHCTLDLLPNSTSTIVGTTEILAGQLSRYPTGAEIELKLSSTLHLDLVHVRVSNLLATSVTTITIQNEMTLARRKWLIAVIAGIFGLIILAILTFILHKVGFFARKEKQKLVAMQEKVKQNTVRQVTPAGMDGPTEDLQMRVVDDYPFEEPRPVTTKDNVGLVEQDEL